MDIRRFSIVIGLGLLAMMFIPALIMVEADKATRDIIAPPLSSLEPAAGSSDQNVPQPPAIRVTSEEELEKHFQTKFEQTRIDRGDKETTIRDRVGEGNIGIFYDHNQDSRINDDDDAIGLEFRLLEFD